MSETQSDVKQESYVPVRPEGDLQSVLEKLDRLCVKFESVDYRLSAIEAGAFTESRRLGREDRDEGAAAPRSRSDQLSMVEQDFLDFIADSVSSTKPHIRGEIKELSDQYLAIKESVSTTEIPSHLFRGDTYFKQTDTGKKLMTVIRKQGGYIVTTLKVLRKLVQEKELNKDSALLIFTVISAQLRSLQSDQATCFWEGTGAHKDQLSIYKTLNSNPFVTKQDAEAFDVATRIFLASKQAADADKSHSSTGGASGRGRGKWRGGWKGNTNKNQPKSDNSSSSTNPRDLFDAAVAAAAAPKP